MIKKKYYYSNILYNVLYDSNTATSGTVPVDLNSYHKGRLVTVLGNTGSLVKIGYTFSGWNTLANGTGTSYDPGDTFNISGDTTLYVKWVQTFTVTYNGTNSVSGTAPTDSNSPYRTGTLVTVLGNSGNLTKPGWTFGGWTKNSDGSGTVYGPNGTAGFAIYENTTLYVYWKNGFTITGYYPTMTPEMQQPNLGIYDPSTQSKTDTYISGNSFDLGQEVNGLIYEWGVLSTPDTSGTVPTGTLQNYMYIKSGNGGLVKSGSPMGRYNQTIYFAFGISLHETTYKAWGFEITETLDDSTKQTRLVQGTPILLLQGSGSGSCKATTNAVYGSIVLEHATKVNCLVVQNS